MKNAVWKNDDRWLNWSFLQFNSIQLSFLCHQNQTLYWTTGWAACVIETWYLSTLSVLKEKNVPINSKYNVSGNQLFIPKYHRTRNVRMALLESSGSFVRPKPLSNSSGSAPPCPDENIGLSRLSPDLRKLLADEMSGFEILKQCTNCDFSWTSPSLCFNVNDDMDQQRTSVIFQFLLLTFAFRKGSDFEN